MKMKTDESLCWSEGGRMCVCVYQHESSYMVKESFYLMRLYVAVYSKRCVVVADGWLGVYLPDACLGYAWLMICI